VSADQAQAFDGVDRILAAGGAATNCQQHAIDLRRQHKRIGVQQRGAVENDDIRLHFALLDKPVHSLRAKDLGRIDGDGAGRQYRQAWHGFDRVWRNRRGHIEQIRQAVIFGQAKERCDSWSPQVCVDQNDPLAGPCQRDCQVGRDLAFPIAT